MNIRITRLSMTNFKCFRGKELNLDEDIVTIRGRNGEGKTTIADAILFCLFGKNVAGQSDLELFKTRENGKVIPNLDHSVELTLHISTIVDDPDFEKDVTLKRSIKEVWVKKRGSEESVFKNNTVEYFVDGEAYTKADYEKYIAFLVDERVFRAITNPNYFPSLKWQDQRNFLTSMVGSIEPECFSDTDELKSLVDYFDQHDEDIEDYLKHRSYQIKEIKKKLEKIPVRLEEQNKALPEKHNWNGICEKIDKASGKLKEVESKIDSIRKGNGSQVKRAELTNQISSTTAAIDKLRFEAQEESAKAQQEKQGAVNQMSIKFQEALNNQKLMEQTIEADKRILERCEETENDCGKQLQKLREEWPTQKFEVDPNTGFCPTCGQPLPADVVEGKIETLRQQFNQNKEAKKQELNVRAAKIKQIQYDAAQEFDATQVKLKEDSEELETIKESINTIFAEKAKLEKEPVKTTDEILAKNVQYVALTKQLSELKASLESVTDSDDDIERLMKLEASKMQAEADINNLHAQLASKEQYDKIISLIDGINEEQKDLVKQLSELEKQEDIARQYQFRQNQLLESRINEHFKLVQWRLFRTVNNGGDSFDEPFCECYVDGIPYHSGLNQAARLNAGLDIVNALCKFYNVSAPIVLDNTESTLNILQTTGQQLRLCVSNCELQIE